MTVLIKKLICLLLVTGMIVSCSESKKELTMSNNKADFEKVVKGKNTTLYTLKNEGGITVTLTNYGARLVSVFAPDRNGELSDVVLGYDSIDGYLNR